MDAELFFSRDWPSVASRLGRYLSAAGVPADDREDLVQETALRVYRAWGSIDQDRPIEPFVRTIAMNAWRDQLRRHRPLSRLELLPERPSTAPSVEHVAVVRSELRAVGHVLRQLTGSQRALLLTAAQPRDGIRMTARSRMARTRARRRLRGVLLEGSGAAS